MALTPETTTTTIVAEKASPALKSEGKISLKLLAGGFKNPLHLVAYPGISGRLLVVEQAGRVLILQDGVVSAEPFLDITSVVESGGEKGLLSIAFHPKFISNSKFYVNYTRKRDALESIISEFKLDPATGKVDLKSEKRLLTIRQPYENHNGGQIAFGPDGLLYIGMGDGGSANDPDGNGQNSFSLLGKILRIDVDFGDPYQVPIDNPYVTDKKGAPEVFALGLRNPWRFSFDRKTGVLWAADVGQNDLEEIDIIEKGKNYGWNVFEGTSCLRVRFECLGFYENPIYQYTHKEGQSITGGFVYRGTKFPELQGLYVYGDYVGGKIWALSYEGGIAKNKLLLSSGLNISSFGEDSEGELYLTEHQKGEIYTFQPG